MQLPATPGGQVREGIAELVRCPADGNDGRLRGAQVPREEQQSRFSPPSLTAQHQSCREPPWRDATSSCGGSYRRQVLKLAGDGALMDGQQPEPSPPVAEPRHRRPACAGAAARRL